MIKCWSCCQKVQNAKQTVTILIIYYDYVKKLKRGSANTIMFGSSIHQVFHLVKHNYTIFWLCKVFDVKNFIESETNS